MVDKTTLKTTNKLADKFHKRYNSKENMEEHRRIFTETLKGKKILDVGCGTGRDCREFSRLGFEVTGIDVSQEMLKIAMKEAPKARLLNLDMNELIFGGKFNGIWVCASLYHIKKEETHNLLKTFYDYLEKDGLLFITVKEGTGEKYNGREYFGELKKFYAFYKDFELIKLLSDANFDVLLMEKEHKDQTWINIYARKQ